MEPTDETSIPPIPKQRHGCVTAWLIFMIIANSLTALLYLFASDLVISNLPGGAPTSLIMALGIIGLANTLFAVMLFQWKKIGFYGFLMTSIATLAINISIGFSIGQSLFGLVGIAVLYGVLQIKQNDIKAWDHLE